MRVGSVQFETLAASVILAGALAIVAGLAGYASLGAAVGLGLLLGTLNAFFIQSMLDRRAPILATSLLRLAFLSLLAVAVTRLFGWSIWPVVAGLGIAQLVMAGVGVRQGRRA